MVRRRPKASKAMKLGFASLCLFAFTFFGPSAKRAISSPDHGRGLVEVPERFLQEEIVSDDECAEVFECNEKTCISFGTKSCCEVVDVEDGEAVFGECFTPNGSCDRSDLCEAEVFPGSNGEIGAAKCFAPFERNRASGIFVYLFFLLYLFLAVAIICDDYFVPALEKISEALNLSDDVAGATFMAAGSSAPELFVSLSDNVISNPPQSLGLGAVVGGGIFNVCVIIGLSAIFAGQDLHLNWRPFARDYFFYIISIALLIIFAANDDEISAVEGIILFLVYIAYVIFMVYNSRIFIWIDEKLGLIEINEEAEVTQEAAPKESEAAKPSESRPSVGDADDTPATPASPRVLNKADALKEYSSFRSYDLEKEVPESYWSVFHWPETWGARVYYLLSLPINIAFRFTVPDCNYDVFNEDGEGPENRRIGYSLSFIMCILWIAILSQFLVFCTTIFGCLVGIDAAVMGLTLLAVGTNIPDALSSIIVARAGKGDMAVANSIGSNVFDILVGLGIPWFIAAVAIEPVPVLVDDIVVALGFLGGSLAFLLGVLIVRKWKMDRLVGLLLLGFYFFYVVFEIFISPLIRDD